MGFLKVKCYRCHHTYRLYGDMVHHEHANVCPNCFAEIPRGIWERCVIPAWGGIEDANRDLQQTHTGYLYTSLFQIGYQATKPYEIETYKRKKS